MDAMKLETAQDNIVSRRRVIILDVTVTEPHVTGVKRDEWRKLPSFAPNHRRRSR